MKAFASVEDYEARYGDADEPEILAEILMDATREIAAALDKANISYSDVSEDFAARLMQACRSMAYRAMGDDTDVPLGATQYSQGAGGYTKQFTFSNPYSELYISKAERRLLGLDVAKIGFTVPGCSP